MKDNKFRGNRAVRAIAEKNAGSIMSAKKKTRVYNLPVGKKSVMWRPGLCLICGMAFDVLTLRHAESHGFKSQKEMCAAGVVQHIDNEREVLGCRV